MNPPVTFQRNATSRPGEKSLRRLSLGPVIRASSDPMLQDLPKRNTLSGQVAELIRTGIKAGTWGEWLPSERGLCERLQVSRNTLRSALALLQKEGVIRAEHGAGNRIVAKPARTTRRPKTLDVGLLSPEPLERLRPTQTLWIDELRGMLSERGCRLHIFHGPQYFRPNPGPALAKLLRQHAHGCWILTLSNESIQTWFSRNSVPCIVAGSVHAELGLPFRDLDHRALCRHAAGTLLALGHRKLAFVVAHAHLAGNLESEAGFSEAVRQSGHQDASSVIARHDGTPKGIDTILRRLLAQTTPPTAFLVANAYHYLKVSGVIAQAGLRVPADVSLISRDEDPFLTFVHPTPCRYAIGPSVLAKSLLRPVVELLNGEVPVQLELMLMPEFLRGDSIALLRTGVRGSVE